MSNNDFTLEELELIQDNLHWSECPAKNQELLKLNHKLEDLISYYCDHDWKHSYKLTETDYCTKCGVE